jgi:ATP-dependent helicase/nuclease subunit B
MGMKVITGRLHFDLEIALFEYITRFRAVDSVSPQYILVGSNQLAAYLRRKLAVRTGGHFNVRFLTLADMVAMLDDPLGRRAPPFAERAIIESMIADHDFPPGFEGAVTSAGFGEALLRTFTDLAEGGCTAETATGIADGSIAYRSLGERTRGLFTLYERFISKMDSLGGDMQSRFRKAAGRAADRTVKLDTAGPVLAYGFYDFNRLQLHLLEALGAGSDIVLFTPWYGRETDRFTEATLARLEACGFEREPCEGPMRPGPVIELYSAPGEEEEARALARRMLSHAEARGARFDGMGLLVPSKEIYLPLFAEAFDEAGVPYNCRGEVGGPAGRIIRGTEALVGLLGRDIDRSNLVDFIVSAPLEPIAGAPDAYRFWVRKSAEAGMIGEGGWRKESRSLREKLKREIGGEEEALSAFKSVEAVDNLIEFIDSARSAVRAGANWSRFSTIVSDAMRHLFGTGDQVSEIADAVGRLGELDAVSDSVSFATFARVLRNTLSSIRPAAARAEGVSILSLGEARGLSFTDVFIPGLAEKIFPTVPRQDPFLTDRERSEITRLTNGEVYLSPRLGRLDEEALLFTLALDSAADRVVCSYPRMEQETGRERIESSFLRFIEGFSPIGEGIRPHRLHRFGRSDDEPLSELEYDYIRALRGDPFVPRGEFFDRAVKMERARSGGGRFTPYEGVFSSQEALGALRSLLERAEWSFSPTSLESYAACPFAYFLAGVLGLELVEEPERLIQITPLQRGSIVHEILAGLFGRLAEKELLPLSPSVRSEALLLTERTVDAYLDAYPSREPTGRPLFWEIEKRMIGEAVIRYIEWEIREESSLVPIHFEKRFGDDPAVSIDTVKGTIGFHGRIDRIDVEPAETFRVIDYKTGRLSDKDQYLAGGTRLQLPVYIIAASTLLARPIEHGVAVYRKVGGGGGRRETRFSGTLWHESEKELERIIETIVGGIENGLFMTVPSTSCEVCRVRSACISGARRAFERKARADERCRKYIAMRGLGGEVE